MAFEKLFGKAITEVYPLFVDVIFHEAFGSGPFVVAFGRIVGWNFIPADPLDLTKKEFTLNSYRVAVTGSDMTVDVLHDSIMIVVETDDVPAQEQLVTARKKLAETVSTFKGVKDVKVQP